MKYTLRLKDLLWDLFADLEETYPDFKIIGDEAIVSFDNDRYAKLSFTIYGSHGTANTSVFNGCEINIISRTKGQLNMKRIAFSDVFDSILDLNHPNKIGKHIWHNGGYDWYGRPTEKDREDLFNAVADYLDMFRIREREISEKTSFDKMLDEAIQRTSADNTVAIAYDKALGFIKDLQEMAVSAEKLLNSNNELDYQLMKNDIVDKLINFNEKDLFKATAKDAPERE